jgi:uncharacterized FAD-dependent dehydrogenase
MKNNYKPKIGDKVKNSDNEVGIITRIDDIHNVFVKFSNGGRGIYCLSKSKKCRRPQPFGHFDKLTLVK